MKTKDKRLFHQNVFLNMEKYRPLSYGSIVFFHLSLSNIASNFLMTELPTANFINSYANLFTDGWTGSPSVILRVCTIHLSTLLLESYYIIFLVMISVQFLNYTIIIWLVAKLTASKLHL